MIKDDEVKHSQDAKSDEDFFKEIESQSHNFVQGGTLLGYLEDQVQMAKDVKAAQETVNKKENEQESSFSKNRREVREAVKDYENVIKDPDGRVIARIATEEDILNYNKMMDSINFRPENENIDMFMMLSQAERKIINEVRQDDYLREILTNTEDKTEDEKAERIRVEKLFDNIQGAPPREMMVSYEEECLIKKQRNKEFLNKLLVNPYDEEIESKVNKLDEFSHIRLEALKLAIEIAKIIKRIDVVKNDKRIDSLYDSTAALLKDVDIIYEIADNNFKYIIGEK